MKKIFALLISLILVTFCFLLPANAQTAITFSDDFSQMNMGEYTYTICNAEKLSLSYDHDISNDGVILDSEKHKAVKAVDLWANHNETIICADITYTNSSTLSITFLRDDMFDEYDAMLNGDSTHLSIDFTYDGQSVIYINQDSLTGEETTLTDELLWADFYEVTASSSDNSISIINGFLLVCDTGYYYIDADKLSSKQISEFFPPDFDSLPAVKLTNQEFIKILDEAYNDTDSFGTISQDVSTLLGNAFLIIAFCAIPLALLIIFLICALRSKTVYKKLYTAIWITSAADLAVFVISFIIIV